MLALVVSTHFFPLLNMCWAVLGCSVMSESLRPHGLQPARFLCPWNFPGKNTGVGCHSLLHRVFPTQGSNPGLPHCRQILYQLSHPEAQENLSGWSICSPADLPDRGLLHCRWILYQLSYQAQEVTA